jgi:hypothetical protein
MRRKRYSTEEKVRILRDVAAGKSIGDVYWNKSIAGMTFRP